MKIAIIGAGVAGFATAITLQENGFNNITLVAEKFTPNTNSDVAAAFWYPYHVGPADKVPGWCQYSLQRYKALMEDLESGVYWFDFADAYETEPDEKPVWHSLIQTKPLPEKFQTCGYKGESITIPMIDMSLYMPFLMKKIKHAAIKTMTKKNATLHEVDDFNVIINCSGLGAVDLCNDATLQPGRGQVCLLEKPQNFENFGYVLQFKDGSFSHINPRKKYIVAGGTNENSWNTEVSEQVHQKILSEVCKLFPELQQAKVIKKVVGLRPCRPEVRLEKETLSNGQTVIHNYGHAGAGVTLSWGCAQDAYNIIRKEFKEQ